MNKKNIILIVLIILSPLILFGLLRIYDFAYTTYIDYLPIPKYKKKTELIDISTLCEKINNDQFKKVCFTIAKDKDFEQGLISMIKTKDNLDKAEGHFIKIKNEKEYLNNRLKYFPGYYYNNHFYSNGSSKRINNINELIAEGANHNPVNWCIEFSTYANGKRIKENYYLCRTFLENPHFCKKILSDLSETPRDKMRRLCYQDAAMVWKDPSLCEKSLNPDVCYLKLALISLKN